MQNTQHASNRTVDRSFETSISERRIFPVSASNSTAFDLSKIVIMFVRRGDTISRALIFHDTLGIFFSSEESLSRVVSENASIQLE